jgi:hypothetical protein
MQMSLKKAVDTLSAAGSLLDKLIGEKASWKMQVHKDSHVLPGLPACANLTGVTFVTYAPAENVISQLFRNIAAHAPRWA